MAACEWAVIPTRFPLRTSAAIIRAPVYVLPEPGGPWIARYEPLLGVNDAGGRLFEAIGDVAGDRVMDGEEQTFDGRILSAHGGRHQPQATCHQQGEQPTAGPVTS